MRGIVVPERTEDFTADPVELFFDLAYVFALSQLVGLLVDNHDAAGVGRVVVLFLLLWLPWQQFTWSANAISGNGRPVRLLFLVATATSVPMAASISTAFAGGGPVFAVCVGIICVLGVATLFLGVANEAEVRRSALRWMVPNLIGLVVLVGGAFVEGAGRTVAWAATIGIVIVAMTLAGQGEWIIRTGHFSERHGLFVIVALGEVIVALGAPVVTALGAGSGLSAGTTVVLAASGAFAGLLWWAYFDRPGPALEHRATAVVGDRERGRFVRDVYSWAHAPVALGIVCAAAALEEIALAPGEPVPASLRALLFGGLAAGFAGIAAAVFRAFRVIARERVVAAVVLGGILLLGGAIDGVVLLVVVDLVLLATLFVEHVRIEGWPRVRRA